MLESADCRLKPIYILVDQQMLVVLQSFEDKTEVQMNSIVSGRILPAQAYLSSASLLAKPMQGDQLFLYLVVLKKVVSSTLIKQDREGHSTVYYTSKTMTDVETTYPGIEKLALALMMVARWLRPYFQAHVFYKLEKSGRWIKWALELSEYDISFKLRTFIKGQAVKDFIAELTPPASLDHLR